MGRGGVAVRTMDFHSRSQGFESSCFEACVVSFVLRRFSSLDCLHVYLAVVGQ